MNKLATLTAMILLSAAGVAADSVGPQAILEMPAPTRVVFFGLGTELPDPGVTNQQIADCAGGAGGKYIGSFYYRLMLLANHPWMSWQEACALNLHNNNNNGPGGFYLTEQTSTSPVPEPATLLLTATGAAAIWLRRRFRS